MYRESLANWSMLRKATAISAEDEHRSADAAQQMAMLTGHP
jgi:hypothetical protein